MHMMMHLTLARVYMFCIEEYADYTKAEEVVILKCNQNLQQLFVKFYVNVLIVFYFYTTNNGHLIFHVYLITK